MEASGVFGAAAAIAAFAGGALCAQAVLRRTRRRRAGEGGIGQHLARNGVRCADGVARRLLSVPKVAALAGDAQAALQGRGVVCTPRSLCSLAVAAAAALALDVQHQVGGSMRPVLEAARETVEGELALRRALRVQTAQARLSARVVTVMPFALVAVFSLVSKGFLDPFLQSPLGLGLLGLACAMEVAGVLAVRRMLNVEVS